MSRLRPLRRLPRYTREKLLANGEIGYFFEPPSWAKKQGCTVTARALGTNRIDAIAEVEDVLLPQFDSWRTGGASDMVPERAAIGTFDWMVTEFKKQRKFTSIDSDTKRTYEQGLALAANHIRKRGGRFGEIMVESIDSTVADALYERLLLIPRKDDDGNLMKDADGNQLYEIEKDENGNDILDAEGKPKFKERRAFANAAMRACRRAWNVVARAYPKRMPKENPFSRMGLTSNPKETPAATYEELQVFLNYAIKNNRTSLAIGALIEWEWAQRPEHVFSRFEVSHYRPKERPDAVKIVHPKTGELTWVPLFDLEDNGAPLYPQLMTLLDEVKKTRIAGLMLVRDWNDKKAGVPIPWVTPKGGIDYAQQETKRLIREAGLREELSLTSFRHGGINEATDSEATDEEVRALTAHKSRALQRYSKRTMKKIANQQKKRLASREQS